MINLFQPETLTTKAMKQKEWPYCYLFMDFSIMFAYMVAFLTYI